MEKTLGFIRNFCCFCCTRPEQQPKQIQAPKAPEMRARRKTHVYCTERFPIAVPGATPSRGGSVRAGGGQSSHIYTPPKRHPRMTDAPPRTKREEEEPEQEWERIAKASLNCQSLHPAPLSTVSAVVEEQQQGPVPPAPDRKASPPQQTGPRLADMPGHFVETPTCRSFGPAPGVTITTTSTTSTPHVPTRSLTATNGQTKPKATEVGNTRSPTTGTTARMPLAALDTNSKPQLNKLPAKSIGSPKGSPFTTPRSSLSDRLSKAPAAEPKARTSVSSTRQSQAMESLLAAFPAGRYGHGYLKRCLTATGGNAADAIEALKGIRELPPSLVGADEKEELETVGGMEVFNAGPAARPLGKA